MQRTISNVLHNGPSYWRPVTIPRLASARCFHTTRRTYIAPILLALLKPIAKVGAIISGRTVRKWWQKLPLEQRQHFKSLIFLSRYKLVGVGGSFAGLGAVYYISHLQTTPITGRRRFIAFTTAQMEKIVHAEAEMIATTFSDQRLPATHPYCYQVSRVVDTLLVANDNLHDLPSVTSWTVNVIESTDRNAFVLPTGDIYVFSGLLTVTENDDQLSIVLGHELSHVLLSHAAEKISYSQVLDWFLVVVMAAIWAVMPTDGIALVTQWFYNKVIQLLFHMPYSRKLENEADQVGLELCAKACYDVREGSTFWTKMSCLSEMEEGTVPEMLSTHPLSEKRAIHLDYITPKAVEIRDSCQCPHLPALDPRMKIDAYRKLTRNETQALKSAQNLQQVLKIYEKTAEKLQNDPGSSEESVRKVNKLLVTSDETVEKLDSKVQKLDKVPVTNEVDEPKLHASSDKTSENITEIPTMHKQV